MFLVPYYRRSSMRPFHRRLGDKQEITRLGVGCRCACSRTRKLRSGEVRLKVDTTDECAIHHVRLKADTTGVRRHAIRGPN